MRCWFEFVSTPGIFDKSNSFKFAHGWDGENLILTEEVGKRDKGKKALVEKKFNYLQM